MDYKITHSGLTLDVCPEKSLCSVTAHGVTWEWGTRPSLKLKDGAELYLHEAKCVSYPYATGIADGVRAEYSEFSGHEKLRVYTYTCVQPDTLSVIFEIRVEGDEPLQAKRLNYPGAFAFGSDDGYTVLPRMQGTLVPAGETISIADGRIQERDAYMCFFGQVRDGCGYIGIYDTPWDAGYCLPGSDMVQPWFEESMGTMRYKRQMRYRFFGKGCDYVTIAKAYRADRKEKGLFVSLEEKIARNPNVAKLIGTPVVHEGIAVHISPESDYYKPDKPEENDHYVPFSTRAEQLKKLKENGLERAYLHLDGWGNHGYDNLHPDPFPPHEKAGGADGMRELADTCRELGYMFGIHDQYRDYYYDAPSFSFDNAIMNPDGTHPFCSIWFGGPHSYLCTSLAPEYVRRNYDEFERLGIRIEGTYLDVFSVVGLDECVSPDHPMTREQCAAYRRQCFELLNERGIITSSEETIDTIVPSIALCHHAPYFTKNLGIQNSEPAGIHVPLFNLVYHDAIIIPWLGSPGTHGGWGIPAHDSAVLHAILNGDTVYCDIDADAGTVDALRPALELHKRLALQEMVSHSFVDGNIRRQRTVFADGTEVEVDFDNDTYTVSPGL